MDVIFGPYQTAASYAIFFGALALGLILFFGSTVLIGLVASVVVKGDNDKALQTPVILTNLALLIAPVTLLLQQGLNFVKRVLQQGIQTAYFLWPILLVAFFIGIWQLAWEQFQPDIMSALDSIWGCYFSAAFRPIVLFIFNLARFILDMGAGVWSGFWRATRFFYRDLWVLVYGCSTSNLPTVFASLGRFIGGVFTALFEWIFINRVTIAELDTDLFMVEFNVLSVAIFDTLYCLCESLDWVWSVIVEIGSNPNLLLIVSNLVNGILFLVVEPINFFSGTNPPRPTFDVSGFHDNILCSKIDMEPQFCTIPILDAGRVPLTCNNLTCSGFSAAADFETIQCEGFNCFMNDTHHGPPRPGLFFVYMNDVNLAFTDYIDEVVAFLYDSFVGQIIATVSTECEVGSFTNVACTVFNETYAENCTLPAFDDLAVECGSYFDGNVTSGLISGIGCNLVGCTASPPQIVVDFDNITLPSIGCLWDPYFSLPLNFLNITLTAGSNAIPWGTVDDTTSSVGPNGLPYWNIDSLIDPLNRAAKCYCDWIDFVAKLLGTIENAIRGGTLTVEGTITFRIINGLCCGILNLWYVITELIRWVWDLIFGTIFELSKGNDVDTFFYQFWGGTLSTAPEWLKALDRSGECFAQAFEAIWFPLRCLGTFLINPIVQTILQTVNIIILSVQAVQTDLNAQVFNQTNFGAMPCTTVVNATYAEDCFGQGINLVECTNYTCNVNTSICAGFNCTSVNSPIFDIDSMPCSMVFSPTSAGGCLLDAKLPVKCISYNCTGQGINTCSGLNCQYKSTSKLIASIDVPLTTLLDSYQGVTECIRDIIFAISDAFFGNLWGTCASGETDTLPFPAGNIAAETAHYNIFCMIGRFIDNGVRLIIDTLRIVLRVLLVLISQDKDLGEQVGLDFEDILELADIFFDDFLDLYSPFHFFFPPDVECPASLERTIKGVWQRVFSVVFTIIYDGIEVIFDLLYLFIGDLSNETDGIIDGGKFVLNTQPEDFIEVLLTLVDVVFAFISRTLRTWADFLNCFADGLGDWLESIADVFDIISDAITDFLLDTILWVIQFFVCAFNIKKTDPVRNAQCDAFFAGIAEFFEFILDETVRFFRLIGEYILDGIKKIINKIVGFFTTIFDANLIFCRIVNTLIDAINLFRGKNNKLTKNECKSTTVDLFGKRGDDIANPSKNYMYGMDRQAGRERRFYKLKDRVVKSGLAWQLIEMSNKQSTPQNPEGFSLLDSIRPQNYKRIAQDPELLDALETQMIDDQFDDRMNAMAEGFANGSLPVALWHASRNSTQYYYCRGIFENYLDADWDEMSPVAQVMYADCAEKQMNSLMLRDAVGLTRFANSDVLYNTYSMIEFGRMAFQTLIPTLQYRLARSMNRTLNNVTSLDECRAEGVDVDYYLDKIKPELDNQTRQWYYDQYDGSNPDFGLKIDHAIDALLSYGKDLLDPNTGDGSIIDPSTYADPMEQFFDQAMLFVETAECRIGHKTTIFSPFISGFRLIRKAIGGMMDVRMDNALMNTVNTGAALVSNTVLPPEFADSNVFSRRNVLAAAFAPRTAIAHKIQSDMGDFYVRAYRSIYGGAADAYDAMLQKVPFFRNSPYSDINSLRYNSRRIPISSMFLPELTDPVNDFSMEDYIPRLQIEALAREEMRKDFLRHRTPVTWLGTGRMMSNRISPRTLDYLRDASYDPQYIQAKEDNMQYMLDKEHYLLDESTRPYIEHNEKMEEYAFAAPLYSKRSGQSDHIKYAATEYGPEDSLWDMDFEELVNQEHAQQRAAIMNDPYATEHYYYYTNQSNMPTDYQKVQPHHFVNEQGEFELNRYKQYYFESHPEKFPMGTYEPLSDRVVFDQSASKEDVLASWGLFKTAPNSNWWRPRPHEGLILSAYKEVGLDVWTRAATPYRGIANMQDGFQKRIFPLVVYGSIALIASGGLNKIPGGLPGKDPTSFRPCDVDNPDIVCQDCKVFDEAVLLGEQIIDAAVQWYTVEVFVQNGTFDQFVDVLEQIVEEAKISGEFYDATPPQSNIRDDKRSEIPRHSIDHEAFQVIGRMATPRWREVFGDNPHIKQPDVLPHIQESRRLRREKFLDQLDQHYRAQGRMTVGEKRAYNSIHYKPKDELPDAKTYLVTWFQHFFAGIAGKNVEMKPSPYAVLYGSKRGQYQTDLKFHDALTQRTLQKRAANPTFRNMLGYSLYRNRTERMLARDLEANFHLYTLDESSPFFGEPNVNEPFRTALDALVEDLDGSITTIVDFLTNDDETDPNGLLFYIDQGLVCQNYADKFLGLDRNFDSLGSALLVVLFWYLMIKGGIRLLVIIVPLPAVFIVQAIELVLTAFFTVGLWGWIQFVTYNFGYGCTAGMGYAAPFGEDLFKFAEAAVPVCLDFDDLLITPLSNPDGVDFDCRRCFPAPVKREYESCLNDRGFLDGTDHIFYSLERYFDTNIVDNIADGTGGTFYQLINNFDYFRIKADRWRDIMPTQGYDICNVTSATGNIVILVAVALVYAAVVGLLGFELFVAVLLLLILLLLVIYAGAFAWIMILGYLSQDIVEDDDEKADEALKKKYDYTQDDY